MATPTRKQALVAAFLMDGWDLNEELSTPAHRVLECEGQNYGRIWISVNGYMRIGGVKTKTSFIDRNPSDRSEFSESTDDMIERGRAVLG